MSGFFDYQLLEHSLIVSTLLFALGLVGFIARRNLAMMAVSSGVMLQGVILAFAAFGSFQAGWSGQIVALLSLFAAVAIGGIVATVLAALARIDGSLDPHRLRTLGNDAAEEPQMLRRTSGVPGSSAICGEHTEVR